MEDDARHAGTILRHKRLELGLSIQDITRLTGIRASIVEAIEAGAFDVMPEVYMRSFVRRYARALGIDERELPPLSSKPTPRSTPATTSARTPQRRLPVIVWAGIALVVGGAVYWLLLPSKGSTTAAPSAETIETVRTTPRGTLLQYFGATGDSLQLEAIATDTAWMSVTMDGRRSEQVKLMPGDRRQWNAQRTIVVSIGNVGAVELYRNGERLPPLGKRGEVVRSVTITRTDVLPSTSSWARRRDSILQTITSMRDTAQSADTAIEQPTQQPSSAKARPLPPSRSTAAVRKTTPQHSTALQHSARHSSQTRRQELLRRAMQAREITPVPPKVRLPNQQAASQP